MKLTQTHDEVPQSPTKWGQERRLEFIDFRLRWEGKLNRIDLMEFFGISKPQASLDIAKYIELAPANLRYDRVSRMYIVEPRFKTVFASSHPNPYLDRMLATAKGEPESFGFVGWHPPTATVPIPGRILDEDVLATVVTAIRETQEIFVHYQAIAGAGETERWLAPHALAHDGYRWHVRAFCYVRQDYRDFLIARIRAIEAVRPSSTVLMPDRAWTNSVRLILTPHPGLSAAATRVVEDDYGMLNGEAVLECREALLFYLLRQLNLGPGASPLPPKAQQIVLKNTDEIESLLTKEPSNSISKTNRPDL